MDQISLLWIFLDPKYITHVSKTFFDGCDDVGWCNIIVVVEYWAPLCPLLQPDHTVHTHTHTHECHILMITGLQDTQTSTTLCVKYDSDHTPHPPPQTSITPDIHHTRHPPHPHHTYTTPCECMAWSMSFFAHSVVKSRQHICFSLDVEKAPRSLANQTNYQLHSATKLLPFC